MWTQAILVTLLISGCAQSYNPQVDAFATTFATANKNFSETIERVEQRIALSNRSLWAQSRTPLVHTGICLELSTQPEAEFNAQKCRLIPATSENPPLSEIKSENLTALAKQLSNYTQALQALTADNADQKAAFEKAVIDAFGSVGKFDSLLAELDTGTPAVGPFAEQLGMGLAKALSLISEKQRFDALERTVNDADKVIQSATNRLNSAELLLGAVDTDLAFERLLLVEQSTNKILKDERASIKSREDAIKSLQEEFVSYRATANLARRSGFVTVAKAHSALREAIEKREDVNPENAFNFATAVSELAEIAEAIPGTLTNE